MMNIALKMTFYLGSENGMCHTGKGGGGGGGGCWRCFGFER